MFLENRIIIGMTGPFGSGCTYISKEFLEPSGYHYLSLSDILRSFVTSDAELSRTELQDFGNKLRTENGPDYLAVKACEIIDKSDEEKWVIDSIRNTHEIELLKKTFGSFYLIATWADQETRWNRIEKRYDRNRVKFEEDDTRDSREKDETGQQVSLCYQMADVIILNENHIISKETDNYEELRKTVQRYIDIIEQKEKFYPSEQETLMTMAYANSMRSSCLQRKVGAIIIDDYGNVFSSGYNEVPNLERPCKQTYGKCYRKYLREKFAEELTEIIEDQETSTKVVDAVKVHFKGLDYCRALHAEESAIVNMARLGSPKNLSNATLYTTTYPCNLCANKIAHVSIRSIVYFEPYPQREAKEILRRHNVKQIPFAGVTFNGYFRFMEVLR